MRGIETVRGPTRDPVGNYLYLDSGVENKLLLNQVILVVMEGHDPSTSGL